MRMLLEVDREKLWAAVGRHERSPSLLSMATLDDDGLPILQMQQAAQPGVPSKAPWTILEEDEEEEEEEEEAEEKEEEEEEEEDEE